MCYTILNEKQQYTSVMRVKAAMYRGLLRLPGDSWFRIARSLIGQMCAEH
jgi:hypothetical protein